VKSTSISISLSIDATVPFVLSAWIGVPLANVNSLHTSPAAYTSVLSPSAPSVLSIPRAVTHLPPQALPAGASQTVGLDITTTHAARALKHCRDHVFLVLLLTPGSLDGDRVVASPASPLASVTVVDLARETDTLQRAATAPAASAVEMLRGEGLNVTEQSVCAGAGDGAGHALSAYLPTFGVWEGEEAGDCSVCLTNPRDTILLPCRHVCVCAECRAQLPRCPICRASIRAHAQFGGVPQTSLVPTTGTAGG
jgi:hypothetical protein